MKKNISSLLFIALGLFACGNAPRNAAATESNDKHVATTETVVQAEEDSKNEYEGKVRSINAAEFKELIYNYEQNPQIWLFKGDRPCVIDFYADWCRPCKMIAPILDELAATYAGKVDFYKIDTQVEQELARVFAVSSIPLVVFCPVGENPQGTMGAYPKDEYVKIIETILAKEESNE